MDVTSVLPSSELPTISGCNVLTPARLPPSVSFLFLFSFEQVRWFSSHAGSLLCPWTSTSETRPNPPPPFHCCSITHRTFLDPVLMLCARPFQFFAHLSPFLVFDLASTTNVLPVNALSGRCSPSASCTARSSVERRFLKRSHNHRCLLVPCLYFFPRIPI